MRVFQRLLGRKALPSPPSVGGFTGCETDSIGRHICFENGRRVARAPQTAPAQQQPKKKTPPQPRHSYLDVLSSKLRNEGGFTFHARSHEFPTKGFAVSPFPERSVAVPSDKTRPADIARFFLKNRDILKEENAYVGAWRDTESHKDFLDVSIISATAEDAERLCREKDQIGYFDLGNKRYVEVNRAATSGGVTSKSLGVQHGAEINLLNGRADTSRDSAILYGLDGQRPDARRGRGSARTFSKSGFTGRKVASDGRTVCFTEGIPSPCNQQHGEDGQSSRETTPGRVRDRRRVEGRTGGVESSRTSASVGTEPLIGLPPTAMIRGVGEVAVGPFLKARQVAADYCASIGLDYHPPRVHVKVDVERAKRIADEYDRMKNDPDDPQVKAAYAELAKETIAQYEAVLKSGLKIEFIDYVKQGDPYAASPRLAIEDIKNNNHFWVFPTEAGFGSDAAFDASKNPLLAKTKYTISGKPACVNDLFRVVHDYFGHAKEGNGMRAAGEENAWRSHSAMFTPLARWAMTSETRGQNSWVNYGPHAEHNKTASGADTVYADQKVGLLPQWVVTDGAKDELPESAIDCGSDIKKAAMLLAQGKRVQLAQPEQVATLIDRMGKMIRKAMKSGKDTPEFDLCKVSVPGTNLFCLETLGVPRIKMPQMRGVPVPGSYAATKKPSKKTGKVDLSEEFIRHLSKNGITSAQTTVRSSYLRASQNQIVGSRVVQLVTEAEAGKRDLREKPIFVTRDNYIVDGHHHWAAIIAYGYKKKKDYKIPVYKLDMDIGSALAMANEFTAQAGLAPKSGGSGTTPTAKSLQIRTKTAATPGFVEKRDRNNHRYCRNNGVPVPCPEKEDENASDSPTTEPPQSGQSPVGNQRPVEQRLNMGVADSGSTGGPTGAPRKERIVTARSEFTKPGNPGLVPEQLRQHLRPHQIEGVAKAITALNDYGGFLLADGCVAAGTRIYDPVTGAHTPIEVLAERGLPHTVLSITPHGLVPHRATAPFRKGVAALYKVVLDDGRNITVTDQHRFLVPSGWTRIADGLCVGHFLACVEGHPACGLGFSPSVHAGGVPHWIGTPEDCLGNCSACCRLDDGQPHLVRGITQEHAPLQDGVHEHSPLWSRVDAHETKQGHTRHHPTFFRPSRNNSSREETRALSWNESQKNEARVLLQACSLQAGPRFVERSGDRPSVFVEQHGRCVSSGNHYLLEDELVGISSMCQHDAPMIGTDALVRQLFSPGGTVRQLPSVDESESVECVFPSNHYSGWHRITSIEFVRKDEFYDMYVPGPENYVAEGIIHHNTGVGKTREALALAKVYADRGQKVLIVTKNEVIKPNWKKGTVSGSFYDDGLAMGVPVQLTKGDVPLVAGAVQLTTYDRLTNLEDKIDKDTLVIWDESHSTKNWDSARSKHAYKMNKAAGGVMYMSATPIDKPLHLPYLFRAKVFGGGSWAQTYTKMGLMEREVYTAHGPIKTWVINPKIGAAEVYRRLSGLFDSLTEAGLILKREISFDGVDVGIQQVALPPEAYEMLTRIDKEVRNSVSAPGLAKALSLMQQRRQLEPYKIAPAVDIVKKELAEGRQVVVFLSRINESEVTDKNEHVVARSEGTAPALVKALHDAGITDVLELHGNAAEKPAKVMAHFQEGRGRVLVATIESGGTGVNLDDTRGDRPRTLLMMTPPFSAVENVQAAGRVWRLNTKSFPRIRYLMTDTDVDRWNGSLIATKMKTLGAAVSGELGVLDVENAENDEWRAAQAGADREHAEPFAWGPVVNAPSPPQASKPAVSNSPPITVSGNTYQHKDAIKAAGGRWNGDQKVWMVPVDSVHRLRELHGLRFSDTPTPVSPPVEGSASPVSPSVDGGRTPPSPTPLPPPTPRISQEQKEAIHAALRQLAASDTDRARERNHIGFNQMDSSFGAQLAEQPTLTDRQAEAAARMLQKYRRQLGDDVIQRIKIEEAPPPPEVENPTRYLVLGNTFANKDAIRRAGGRWDSSRSGWVIPANARSHLDALRGLRFVGEKALRAAFWNVKNLGAHDFGCLMLALPDELARRVTDFALSQIQDAHLAPQGRELNPHITCVYGFQDTTEEIFDDLADVLRRFGPITVSLGDLKIFKGGEKGDVLYVAVDSPQLQELHQLLRTIFDVEPSKFPSYVPHVCVAYLQAGEAAQYTNKNKFRSPFAGETYILKEMDWSAADGDKRRINLALLPTLNMESKSYFANCPRDEQGHCLPHEQADRSHAQQESSASTAKAARVQQVDAVKARIADATKDNIADAQLAQKLRADYDAALTNVRKIEGSWTEATDGEVREKLNAGYAAMAKIRNEMEAVENRATTRRMDALKSAYSTRQVVRELAHGLDPGLSYTETIARYGQEHVDAAWNRVRAAEKEWESRIRYAVTFGVMTVEEAKILGSSIGTSGYKYEPITGDLYHVTTAADAVLHDGLKTRQELHQNSGKGLGGGDDTTISFTYSLEAAKAIRESMREALKVARGEITAHDLLREAHEHGFIDDVLRQDSSDWKGQFDPAWLDDPQAAMKNLPIGIADALLGITTATGLGVPPSDPGEWKPHPKAAEWKRSDGKMAYTLWYKPLDVNEIQTRRFQLYKTFSYWREQRTGKLDPLFFGSDLEGFSKVDSEQIQLLHVRPKSGIYGYKLPAEKEWRIHTGDAVDIVGVVPEDSDNKMFDDGRYKSLVVATKAVGVAPRAPHGFVEKRDRRNRRYCLDNGIHVPCPSPGNGNASPRPRAIAPKLASSRLRPRQHARAVAKRTAKKPTTASKPVDPIAVAREQWERFNVHAPAFKAWFGDWEQSPETASKAINPKTGAPDPARSYSRVIDEATKEPIIVYHGTTHSFDAFDESKVATLNHLGKGFYFSGDEGDADSNYGREGPDLRLRIELLAERIAREFENGWDYENEMYGITEEQYLKRVEDGERPYHIAEGIARQQLKGDSPHIERCYLNLRNPVILGVGQGATFFNYEFPMIEGADGELKSNFDAPPEGLGSEFINALREVASDYTKEGMDEPINVDKIIEDIDLFSDEGMYAEKLVRRFFNSAEVMYAGKDDPETGQFEYMSGQLLNDVFRKMGFDGIIYQDASTWFPNMGIAKGTHHYIAFHPNQIKSVDNIGTFNPTDPNIHKTMKIQHTKAIQRGVDKRNREYCWDEHHGRVPCPGNSAPVAPSTPAQTRSVYRAAEPDRVTKLRDRLAQEEITLAKLRSAGADLDNYILRMTPKERAEIDAQIGATDADPYQRKRRMREYIITQTKKTAEHVAEFTDKLKTERTELYESIVGKDAAAQMAKLKADLSDVAARGKLRSAGAQRWRQTSSGERQTTPAAQRGAIAQSMTEQQQASRATYGDSVRIAYTALQDFKRNLWTQHGPQLYAAGFSLSSHDARALNMPQYATPIAVPVLTPAQIRTAQTVPTGQSRQLIGTPKQVKWATSLRDRQLKEATIVGSRMNPYHPRLEEFNEIVNRLRNKATATFWIDHGRGTFRDLYEHVKREMDEEKKSAKMLARVHTKRHTAFGRPRLMGRQARLATTQKALHVRVKDIGNGMSHQGEPCQPGWTATATGCIPKASSGIHQQRPQPQPPRVYETMPIDRGTRASGHVPYKNELGFEDLEIITPERGGYEQMLQLEEDMDAVMPIMDKALAYAEAVHETATIINTWDGLSEDEKDEAQEQWVSKQTDTYREEAENQWREDLEENIRDDVRNDETWHNNEFMEWARNKGFTDESIDGALNNGRFSYSGLRPDCESLTVKNDDTSPLDYKSLLRAWRDYEAERENDETEKRVAAAIKEGPPDSIYDDAYEASYNALNDWESLSDSNKLNAAGYDATETVRIEEPNEWLPFTGENDRDDYRKTQVCARYLQKKRAADLFKERGIPSDVDPETVTIEVWDAWKSSSTSTLGLAFQVAAAEELGGYFRADVMNKFPYRDNEFNNAQQALYATIAPTLGVHADTSEKSAAIAKSVLAAYVRACWEASQYVLRRAGIQHVQSYRGVMLPIQSEPTQEVGGRYTRLPNINLQKNGAASATTKRDVANSWDGVGKFPPGAKRVVLRIDSPRSAILSLPCFGQNYYNEQEIVVAGNMWNAWDAWKGAAPEFTVVPLKEAALKIGMKSMSDDQKPNKQPTPQSTERRSLIVNLTMLEMGQPHWLSKPKQDQKKRDRHEPATTD